MSDRLRIRILGCGSSGGVPRIGNDWGACDPLNPRNRRLRCSLLVERVSAQGVTRVLIDTGPDLREQMLTADVPALDAVLYTHSHADHLHGIDDLRQFAMLQRQRMPVYMDDRTYCGSLRAFSYCFETPAGSSYPPILDRHRLEAGETTIIDGRGGPIDFLPIEVEHGEIPALGFRIRDIAYLPDVSGIPAAAAPAFADLQLWILDCLRPTPHPSHFHLEQALGWIERMSPREAVLTNLHNSLDHDDLDAMTPAHVRPAHDMMLLEFPID